ncbi:MAG: thioredoxin domain-containing protein [Candidatus Solibacter sp.]|nr:thioredoxin domain-containing protein [Candidatus Solibacter sp.]
MKVAECRVKDPNCSFSRGLASVTVGAIKAGKSETAAVAESKASKFGSRPTPKLLDDPVPIPTLGSPVLGPANARITLVEFSDFQCPYCSKAVAQINATLKAYPNDVRLIFKQYPLETHPAAAVSAAASLAAHRQGKFWPMHDVMFANRPKLSRQSVLAWAKQIGLDMQRFTADLDSDVPQRPEVQRRPGARRNQARDRGRAEAPGCRQEVGRRTPRSRGEKPR